MSANAPNPPAAIAYLLVRALWGLLWGHHLKTLAVPFSIAGKGEQPPPQVRLRPARRKVWAL